MKMRVFVPRDAGALAVGADDVAAAMKQAAHARGLDITIIRNGSRGLYWLEPMVEVATLKGRVAYGPVDPTDVPFLFEAMASNGPHALRLGIADEIPWLKRQTRLTFARSGVIDPRLIESYRAHGGYKGLERALSLTSGEILADVMASGLRGRGGAGFPTGIKWKTVADAKAERKYIVCNADEGDSGTFADRMIMEGDPFVLIEGMTIAAITVGATKGYIYIRSEYPHAVIALNAAIAAAKRANMLGTRIGDSAHTFDLEVRIGAGAYVCGEETALFQSIEGYRGEPRNKPPFPVEVGLYGKPTVVNNVETLLNVPHVLLAGDTVAADHDVEVGRLEDGQAGHVAGTAVGEDGPHAQRHAVGRFDQHLLARADFEAAQHGAARRVGPQAAGDPVAQEAVFQGADVEALAALVRHRGGGLEQNEALLGPQPVGAAAEGVAAEGEEVEVGALAAQREFEAVLAVLVAVAGAHVAAGPRQHRHDLVAETDRLGPRPARRDGRQGGEGQE